LDQVNISPPSEAIKKNFFNSNSIFFYCTELRLVIAEEKFRMTLNNCRLLKAAVRISLNFLIYNILRLATGNKKVNRNNNENRYEL